LRKKDPRRSIALVVNAVQVPWYKIKLVSNTFSHRYINEIEKDPELENRLNEPCRVGSDLDHSTPKLRECERPFPEPVIPKQ
jgi:hypothetical protein